MTTHRRSVSAALLAAAALLCARHASAADAATDEIVVYGKRSEAFAALDRDSLRIDVDRHRRALSTSLERALAAERNASPSRRVASAATTPRG